MTSLVTYVELISRNNDDKDHSDVETKYGDNVINSIVENASVVTLDMMSQDRGLV